MNRQTASKLLRDTLDNNSLQDWHIRLTTDITKPYLGLCSYKDKCIILNAFHIDTHPDAEIINTIKHEVAHALVPEDGHGSIWAAKAKELGCDNTEPCAHYSLSDEAIDAIRSGADLKVEFEEQIIRKPKYTVHKLQDKCNVCGKIAKVIKREEKCTKNGNLVIIELECGHFQFKNISSTSPFETIVFDVPTNGDDICKGNHTWNKTICIECGAKKLFPFQVEGARALERANGRLALLDEMGLGKTIMPLAYLKFHPEAFPFLWVTKSGTKYQHAKEIVRLLGWNQFPQILTSGKLTLIPKMNILASYDIFRRLDLEMFKEHGIKTVILDECQAIKNPDSSRTQCIRAIIKHVDRIIPTSGTFWKNRGSEAFVMCNMLDPGRFYSFEAFKKKHVAYGIDGKELGLKKEFREYISDIAIRRERIEVMPELPLVNRTKLVTELPEHARSVYNEERDKLIALVKDAAIDGTENTFEFHQKANQSLMIMKQVVGIAKVPATVEFAKEFLEDTDRKLVIFVHHKACGKSISEEMISWCAVNNQPEPLVLTADLSSEERFNIQEKFNSPKYRLMIASTLASGEGLNLQSCSDCIMHERQWNPANEEQAEGRFIRIGQLAQSVTATYVHGDDSIDTDLDKIVERKRVAFHHAMNKGELPQWSQESIVKELIASIVSNKKKR